MIPESQKKIVDWCLRCGAKYPGGVHDCEEARMQRLAARALTAQKPTPPLKINGMLIAVIALFVLLLSGMASAQGLSAEDEIKFDQALVKLDKARNRLLNIREKLFGVEQTLSDQGIVAENASGRVGDISTTNLDWKKRNDVAGALSGFLAPFLGLLGVSGVGAGAIFAVRSRAKKRAAAGVSRPTVHLAGLPKSWRGANTA